MTNSLSFEELCRNGRAHLKAGRLDDALVALSEAGRMNELDADVHEGLATIHFLKQDYESAVQHFERVTRLDPRRGAAWVNLGAVYNRMANYQKAAEVLRRAVQIERRSSEGYYNLGIAYKHLKQWALAVPAYREAIRLDPKMAEAYLNLGNVYVAMKNFAQAASHYRRALDLKPGLERAVRGLEKAEAELETAKSRSSPFGRLVDAEKAASASAAAPESGACELSPDERKLDRRTLNELLVRLDQEFGDLVGLIEEQLDPSVRTLNKMLTHPESPHGVSITKAEALEQFIEAKSRCLPSLAQFRKTLRELRDHETQFQ
jgi:tetratricopeptide (TPR) repeat protein